MDKINELIREAKDNAREANQRLNEYTDNIHNTSTENISLNAGGVGELGSIVSDLATSVAELGEVVSAQAEEIEKLKGEKK